MSSQGLRGVSCVSATDCWTVGSYVNENNQTRTLAQHWDGKAWIVVTTPNVPNTDLNRLNDVACNAASDCWAVGRSNTNGTDFTLIEHWDGSSWSIVSSPNTDHSNVLTSVSCISVTDCWTVGYSSQALAVHWDGNAWSIVATPDLENVNRLQDIACTSSTNCWAVGFYFPDEEPALTMIERWDGKAWTIVTSPNNSPNFGNLLFSVTCASDSDCWAVGYAGTKSKDLTLIEHWDGDAWSISSSPSPPVAPAGYSILFGVTCVSSSNCWAVGDTTVSEQQLIQHWDGVSWSLVASANVVASGNSHELRAIECTTAAQCWAVGDIDGDTSLIEGWDGFAWSAVESPRVDGGGLDNFLFDVTCNSNSDCWSVGSYLAEFFGTSNQTLIKHWDGEAWTIVPSPNVEQNHSFLFGVTCTSALDCWAVGDAHPEGDSNHATLIEHWDGNFWSMVDSPNPAIDNVLQKVVCTSTSDCWAVGFYYDESVTAHTMIQHWNGTAWTVVPSPDGSAAGDDFLSDVACTSASDCWAVGYYFEGATGHALFEHWDGNAWSLVAPPDPGVGNSNLLQSVACNSSTDCWAVGISTTPGNQHTLFQHWDGVSWMIVATPSITVSAPILNSVSCSSSTECWAVGRYFDPVSARQPMVIRWDGNEWSFFSSPKINSEPASQLRSVTCTSASHCWGVGDYQSAATGLNKTLIEALTPIPALTDVVSTKLHDTTAFDVDLPANGTGVECRRGGANGDYTVVFNFASTVSSVDSVNVTAGTGAVANCSIGADPHQFLVNLTGVTNAQRLTLTLNNARDSEGNIGNAISATMGVLFGDSNGDGAVNSSDISQTKSQSGQDLTNTNFRTDLNADGAINSADVLLVKSRSGTALP